MSKIRCHGRSLLVWYRWQPPYLEIPCQKRMNIWVNKQFSMCFWISLQLLDVYFEAYQHALDPEERFALAQAIIDIMHKHPRFDLKLEYFVNTYKDECICLQLHHQLLRDIVNQQVGWIYSTSILSKQEVKSRMGSFDCSLHWFTVLS